MEFLTVKPFFKWVGGKGKLLTDIRKFYPSSITKYCEPFVGGGAVLFDILANFHPDEILINDLNKDLINTYSQVKDNVEDLITLLSKMEKEYKEADAAGRKNLYYQKRDEYNSWSDKNNDMERAALFIFLNKTCFNGLYRVNSKGNFNTPAGEYKNPLICDEAHLREISQLLQKVTMQTGSYKKCKNFIDENTFVYFDPPYRPLNATSAFTAYSSDGFNDDDQKALAEFVKQISDKGAEFILSNSDPKNIDPNDNFFDDLYSDFSIKRIQASRSINSKGDKRGKVNEILVYKNKTQQI